MLEYCVCPKCERMIMLDSEFASGFCLYCGTHIAYSEAREELLNGLRAAIPDELVLEADLSELLPEDDISDSADGIEQCREECEKAKALMLKWDFAKAYYGYEKALEWYAKDFEGVCGLMTAGILKLNDVENWEKRLNDTIALIRSQNDWMAAQKSLEYALGIVKKFLSKGGRFISPAYTRGFFAKVMESFPAIRGTACEIFAHCLNIDNAPFTDAARLDHETTRYAVGSYPDEPDKELRHSMLLVLKYHDDPRVKESLCRALYVYDRAVWLRNKDDQRINDAISLCETVTNGGYTPENVKIVLGAAYDLLMMGGLEQNTTQHEKLLFLSRVYSIEQVRRMNRFFSGSRFFNRVYSEVYLKQKNANPLSAEYKRIEEKIRQLSD